MVEDRALGPCVTIGTRLSNESSMSRSVTGLFSGAGWDSIPLQSWAADRGHRTGLLPRVRGCLRTEHGGDLDHYVPAMTSGSDSALRADHEERSPVVRNTSIAGEQVTVLSEGRVRGAQGANGRRAPVAVVTPESPLPVGSSGRGAERDDWCVAAFRRLHIALGARRRAGPTDADESFTEGIGEVVAFVPVPPDAPGHPVRLPSGPSSIVDGQHPWMCSQQERNRRHPS